MAMKRTLIVILLLLIMNGPFMEGKVSTLSSEDAGSGFVIALTYHVNVLSFDFLSDGRPGVDTQTHA